MEDAKRRALAELDRIAAIKPACKSCRFAALAHAGTGTVECRRYPPAPYFEPTGKVSNIRPRVGDHYWCGEFEPDERL